MSISFGTPKIVARATNSDIDTSEEDIATLTDLTWLSDTQFTIFFDYSLGTNTSIKIRYYVRREKDGDWFQLPVKNEATGVLIDLPTVINSTSPASRVIEERPVPACFAFKITGQGVGGANSSVTATLLQRKN